MRRLPSFRQVLDATDEQRERWQHEEEAREAAKQRRERQAAWDKFIEPLGVEYANCRLGNYQVYDDPGIAISGFETAERIRPDLARIKRFLAEPTCWDELIRYLPRYQSPDLIPLVRTMLHKDLHKIQMAPAHRGVKSFLGIRKREGGIGAVIKKKAHEATRPALPRDAG